MQEGAAGEAVASDMLLHVEAGVTAVDCGDIYTGVEGLLGRFLRDHRPTSILPTPVQVCVTEDEGMALKGRGGGVWMDGWMDGQYPM